MRRLFSLIIFIFFSICVSNAQVKIEGSISPIGDNLIFVIGTTLKSDKTLAYTQVNEQGYYSLIINSPDQKYILLKVKGLGIKTIVKEVENKAQRIDFKVEQEIHQLKEITVKAKKIRSRGDTITYSAGSYLSKNDVVLKDLLRKMPGITVDNDGKIQFNGQWIKDFYIEGSNLLDDRYNIATNNINAEDIASVQVLRNHQEAKILQGKEYSDQPAINIRLKKGAKGVWASTLEGHIGATPVARDLNFNIMKFAARYQNISLFKSNNIGSDLRQEIQAPTNINTPEGIGLVLPEKAPIENSWSYLNNSHTSSINQLFKLGQDQTLAFNINYLYDKESRESNDYRNIFLPNNQELIFQEQNKLKNRQHFLASNINYKLNSTKWYLKNSFRTLFNYNHADGVLKQRNSKIEEDLNQKFFSVSNNLVGQTPSKHLLSQFSSKLSFQTAQSTLKLPIIHQQFDRYTFETDHSLSLYRTMVNRVQFDISANIMTMIENIKIGQPYKENRESMFRYGLYVMPRLSYLHPDEVWQCFIYCPIGINGYQKKDSHSAIQSGRYWGTRPMLSINYKATDRLEVIATGAYQEEYNGLLELLPFRYYMDYHTLFSNETDLVPLRNKSLKGSILINYKDILNMLFANLSFTVADIRKGYMNNYRAENDKIVYQLVEKEKYYQVFQIAQEFSKGFYKWNSKITEMISMGCNRQNYLIGGKHYNGHSKFITAQLGGVVQPFKRLSVSSENDFAFTQSFLTNQKKGEKYYTINSRNKLWINPFDPIVLWIDSELYYNSYFSSNRIAHLLNTSLEWNLKKIVFNIRCINLFNQNIYQRIIDNGISRSVNNIQLRGRTFLVGIRVKLF